MTIGVPQSDHLPLFFILFINHSNISLFADAATIFESVKSLTNAKKCQTDIASFHTMCNISMVCH